jgi:hypothetical protein
MSSLGPGLRLERPNACGTSIRQPVVEKIRVVIIPRGQMKKNIVHRELLISLRLATGKAKRAANILTFLINNKLFKDLLEPLSLLEVMVIDSPAKQG